MQQPLQQQQLDSQQPYAAAHAQQYPADSGLNDATASMQQLQLQPQQQQQQQPPAPIDHASQQHILAAHSYPAAHVDDSARMNTGMGPVALVGPPLQSPSGPLTDPDGLDQSHDPTAPPLESQPATLGTDGLSWMAASSMQALPVTVYYSQDPISNLQIRVLLRRQPDEAASLTNPRTLKQLNLALKDKARRDAIAAEEAARRATEEGNTSAATAARAARATAARVDEGDEAAPDGPSNSPRGPDGRRMLSPDPLAADAFAPSVVVTQLFAWQQKVPSPAEIMLAASGARSAASYADQVRNMLRVQDPSVTGADPATMVRAAQQLLASAPDGMALSSKRDHDRYVDPDDLHKRVLASNSSAAPSLNPLAERVVLAPLAARRGQSHLTREGVATPFHILATVDLPRGGDPARIRLVNPAADELDNHPPRILGSFQKPLAALKVRESLPSSGGSGSGSGGVGQVTLEMRPPFSPPQKDPTRFDDAEWYTFATPSGEVYRYRLENFSALQEGDTEAAALASASAAASSSSSGAKAARSSRSYIAIEESRLAAEAARISAQEMALKMRRSGRDFDRGPPPGYSQWHVYGEVVKLSGFDEEDLSVALFFAGILVAATARRQTPGLRKFCLSSSVADFPFLFFFSALRHCPSSVLSPTRWTCAAWRRALYRRARRGAHRSTRCCRPCRSARRHSSRDTPSLAGQMSVRRIWRSRLNSSCAQKLVSRLHCHTRTRPRETKHKTGRAIGLSVVPQLWSAHALFDLFVLPTQALSSLRSCTFR